VISAQNSCSAHFVSAQGFSLPANVRVRHWSDVVYLHLLRMSESRPARDMLNLRYVFRCRIANPTTLAVIAHVLRRYRESMKTWPGLSLDCTGDPGDFRALLGTPHGIGVAHLLFQHKRTLAHKSVYRITILNDDEPIVSPNWRSPSLVFDIRDV
jgi:hypothetical protein